MKKIYFILFLCTLVMTNCVEDDYDGCNETNYDTVNISFTASMDGSGDIWSDGDEISIYASCTRDGRLGVSMSANSNAKYKYTVNDADGESQAATFTNATLRDVIGVADVDKDFRILACYPYVRTNDAKAVPVEVPSTQTYMGETKGFYTASYSSADIPSDKKLELKFNNIFASLKFEIPGDLFADGGSSVIRKMTVKPVVEGNLLSPIAVKGSYDLTAGILNAETESREITVDFGEEGLPAAENATTVYVTVNPFTIPEYGFELTFTDDKGNSKLQTILDSEEDKGRTINPGDELGIEVEQFVPEVDGVEFPVIFPLGFTDGVSAFSESKQPRWKTESVWECESQPQAFAQWHYVNSYPPLLAYMDKPNADLGSPQIGNIWTGDYMEFTLPVTDFKAGTTVSLEFEIYTRQGPIFWNIEYDDGDEVKCEKSEQKSYDAKSKNQKKCECTFALHHGNDDNQLNIFRHDMKFQNGIKSGHLKFRIKCADGTVQANTKNETVKREAPYRDSSNGAPFYFRKAGSATKAVTISIKEVSD